MDLDLAAGFCGVVLAGGTAARMDGVDKAHALDDSIAFVMAHPGWELSLQTHNYLGLP